MRRSISLQLASKFKNSRRLSDIIVILSFVFILNQTHNGQIAHETKARDNSYFSWRALTSDEDFFSGVKNRDILISNSQNDAYETNAGSFFHFTGIRLVYLFRTVSIWPEIDNCSVESDCVLDRGKERVINILPTLNRIGPDPENDRKMTKFDWVKENMQPEMLDQSRIWFFDIFPMTPNTVAAYLAPNIETSASASVKVNSLRVATLSRGVDLEFRPSIGGFCLEELPKNHEVVKNKFGVQMKIWKPSQKIVSLDQEVLDIRSLNMGTC